MFPHDSWSPNHPCVSVCIFPHGLYGYAIDIIIETYMLYAYMLGVLIAALQNYRGYCMYYCTSCSTFHVQISFNGFITVHSGVLLFNLSPVCRHLYLLWFWVFICLSVLPLCTVLQYISIYVYILMFMMFLFLWIKFPEVGFLSQRMCNILILRAIRLFSQRVRQCVALLLTGNPCWQWVSAFFKWCLLIWWV